MTNPAAVGARTGFTHSDRFDPGSERKPGGSRLAHPHQVHARLLRSASLGRANRNSGVETPANPPLSQAYDLTG
jgi:hypothetical protein